MSSNAAALCRLPMYQQREALRAGDADALALLEAHLARIAAQDPLFNSFLHVDVDGARAQAADSAQRLASGKARSLEGLPIAVKDNLDVAGLPSTAGMATRRERIAGSDAGVVRRLRDAGAVILGKLNMHEAALGADNDNPHYGACHNPHRHGYTPGGSSGGSAASVAAGLAAASLGSDSMGSVRIPASYCGIYGLKPSRGLLSTAGSVVVSSRLDHVGPMARSPRDLRLLLKAMRGEDPACPASRAINLRSMPSRALQIRMLLPSGTELEPSVEAGFRRGVQLLRDLGHQVEALADGDIQPGPLRRAGLLLCEAEMLVEHADDWRHQRELFSPGLARMLAWAEQRTAVDMALAIASIDQARCRVQQWLSGCDLLVSPTTPQTAFAFGQAAPPNQADLTCLASFAGVPAMSLPVPVSAGELPVGFQLIARHGDDLLLLTLAEAWERISGPFVSSVDGPRR